MTAEKRGHAALAEQLAALNGSASFGPVLTECEVSDVSSANVQAPSEGEVEMWLATEDGGFVELSDSSMSDEEMTVEVYERLTRTKTKATKPPVEIVPSDEEVEDLSYWGF